VIKLTGYLSGCVYALFLAGYISMVLLGAYPSSGFLWQVNLAFAREVRPLFERLDTLAGGSSVLTILCLSTFAGFSVAAAKYSLRLLAAGLCHIALAMVVIVLVESVHRTSLRGPRILFSDPVRVVSGLTVSQYVLIALAAALAALCLAGHVSIFSRGLAIRRKRAALTQRSRDDGLEHSGWARNISP
jgi:hypothetical protein